MSLARADKERTPGATYASSAWGRRTFKLLLLISIADLGVAVGDPCTDYPSQKESMDMLLGKREHVLQCHFSGGTMPIGKGVQSALISLDP